MQLTIQARECSTYSLSPPDSMRQMICQHIHQTIAKLSVTGLASSSTGRYSRAEGPKFGKLWKGLRPAGRNFGPETGAVSTIVPATMHLPAPWEAAGRDWPRPFKGGGTSWSRFSRGACEPCLSENGRPDKPSRWVELCMPCCIDTRN
jgi:hypothetical protein